MEKKKIQSECFRDYLILWCLAVAGMLAIPIVVLVQHTPTSRLIHLSRKSFIFVSVIKETLSVTDPYLCFFPLTAWTDVSSDNRRMVLCLLWTEWVRSCFCRPSVVGCLSWDLPTMWPSPAVPCRLQKSIEHLSMTWGLTRRVFKHVVSFFSVCICILSGKPIHTTRDKCFLR